MHRLRIFPAAALAAVALCLALAGCAASAAGAVTVFAASSLTDVMEELAQAYTAEHPHTRIEINYGSSTQLVQQVKSGARPDVLVTADQAAMAALSGTGVLAGTPQLIAANNITLALAPGNPAGIEELADVARPGVKVARCAPAVPCGRAAQRVLDASGLELPQTAQENSARAVLTKIATGQADAGFVYVTDALAGSGQGVTHIRLPDPDPNTYPAALTRSGAGNAAAADFHQWLSGRQAARILDDAGFSVPGTGGAGTDQ